MNEPSGPAGLAGFLHQLSARGIRPARCGGFVGLQGPGLHRLPAWTWPALDRYAGPLARSLPDEPTPYARRQGRIAG
jgi:hypothetical protein